MANTLTSTASEPVGLRDGITAVLELTVLLDTINTDFTVRSATTGKRMWVVGVYAEAGNSGNVTFKSSGGTGVARLKKIPVSVGSPKGGSLFWTHASQDLIVQADVTISKLVLQVIETDSSVKPSFTFPYNGGSGGGGSSGPTDSNGIPYFSPGIVSFTPSEISVAASTSNAQIFAAGAKRVYLLIQNQGAADAYITSDGNDAVADGTATKLASGAAREWNAATGVPPTRICVITLAGTATIHAEQAF